MKTKLTISFLIVVGTLLVFSFSLVIGAEEEPVEFPNRDVELAVKQQLGKATGDVYPSDLEKLKRFKSPIGSKMGDLTWIKYCKNLERLNLVSNEITNITPLSSLTSLEWLRLQNNNISDLSPLSDLHKLEFVNLRNNNVTDIKPLVENKGIEGNEKVDGLGKGDTVFIHNNNLNLSEGSEDLQDIQTLLDRGVDVTYYPQKEG